MWCEDSNFTTLVPLIVIIGMKIWISPIKALYLRPICDSPVCIN